MKREKQKFIYLFIFKEKKKEKNIIFIMWKYNRKFIVKCL